MTLTAQSPAERLEAEDWVTWLAVMAPKVCTAPFGAHHVEFWEWVWTIEPVLPPGVVSAFVAAWARGGAKSSSAEAAVQSLGARGRRRYALYVCDTQPRADDHVASVATLFESDEMATFYPDHADRAVGKFGNPKGWRRNRLHTQGGFIVDALGLDVATRGVKVEDARPDLIILDDVDGRHDTTRTTTKKLETITQGVLPAGDPGNTVVIFAQNVIHPNGVMARLIDGRADMLSSRILSGPIPALRNMTVNEHGEVDGEPTWEGQDVATCNAAIKVYGLRSFSRESQHDVAEVEGALWRQQWIEDGRCRDVDWYWREVHETLRRVVVAIDPNVTSDEGADEAGIVPAGETAKDWCPMCETVTQPHYFVMGDESGVFGPAVWAKRGVALHHRLEGDHIIGETNNGGELVALQVRQADRDVPFREVKASRGKQIRAEPVASLYDPSEGGECRVHHVGVLDALETQLTTWVHGDPNSPGRLDALVWALTSLIKQPKAEGQVRAPQGQGFGQVSPMQRGW